MDNNLTFISIRTRGNVPDTSTEQTIKVRHVGADTECSITAEPLSDLSNDQIILEMKDIGKNSHYYAAKEAIDWLKRSFTSPNNREEVTKVRFYCHIATSEGEKVYIQVGKCKQPEELDGAFEKARQEKPRASLYKQYTELKKIKDASPNPQPRSSQRIELPSNNTTPAQPGDIVAAHPHTNPLATPRPIPTPPEYLRFFGNNNDPNQPNFVRVYQNKDLTGPPVIIYINPYTASQSKNLPNQQEESIPLNNSNPHEAPQSLHVSQIPSANRTHTNLPAHAHQKNAEIEREQTPQERLGQYFERTKMGINNSQASMQATPQPSVDLDERVKAFLKDIDNWKPRMEDSHKHPSGTIEDNNHPHQQIAAAPKPSKERIADKKTLLQKISSSFSSTFNTLFGRTASTNPHPEQPIQVAQPDPDVPRPDNKIPQKGDAQPVLDSDVIFAAYEINHTFTPEEIFSHAEQFPALLSLACDYYPYVPTILFSVIPEKTLQDAIDTTIAFVEAGASIVGTTCNNTPIIEFLLDTIANQYPDKKHKLLEAIQKNPTRSKLNLFSIKDEQLIIVLINSGIDTSTRDPNTGTTLLQHFLAQEKEEIVNLLLDKMNT